MRDKNLTPEQFNIQLEKAIAKVLSNEKFLRTPVSDSPKCLTDDLKFSVKYPVDFKGFRSLAISQWYFPEELHWRILLDLKERTYSQFNEKQKLEIAILLESKSVMQTYLYETERYSGRELFGNILGNELRNTLKLLKVSLITLKKPQRTIRHRGYRDHGSLKPAHRWLPSSDFSLTEYQNHLEKKRYLTLKTASAIIEILKELQQRMQKKLF